MTLRAVLIPSEKQLFHEQPLQAVMLLSLTGVGTILANQWHTMVDKNLERTTTLIKGVCASNLNNVLSQSCVLELLSEVRTVGKVHWSTKTKAKEPKESDEPKAKETKEATKAREPTRDQETKAKEGKESKEETSSPQEVEEEPLPQNTVTYNCSLYGLPHLTLLQQQ